MSVQYETYHMLLSSSISEGLLKILSNGFRNVLVVTNLLRVSNNEGNNKRLERTAMINVKDIKSPIASIPPNEDMENIINPKNRTIEE